MEQPIITVETPKDSTILAYGTAPPYRRRRIVIGAAVVMVCLTLVGLVWAGFRQRVPTGAVTLAIIARPSTAQQGLPREISERLPLPWRQALGSSSIWPVLLGGGLGPNGWEWFAVMPRWRSAGGLPQATAGLNKVVYDRPLTVKEGSMAYSETVTGWVRSPFDEARGWFETGDVASSSSLFTFSYRDGMVRTSLAFEHEVATFQPRQADLSLDLSTLGEAVREELMKGLPVPSFTQFPSLQEVHLVFRDHGPPETVQLVHREPLSSEQSRQVLAGFGVTSKRVVRLPDGTLATELLSVDEEMKEPVRVSADRELWLRDREIRYGSSTEVLSNVPLACGSRPVVGRLSADALDKLAQSIGLVFETSALKGWQLGRDREGMMIFCKE